MKFNYCPGCGEIPKPIFLTINELSFCKNCYDEHLEKYIGEVKEKSKIKKLKYFLEINFEFPCCPGCGKKILNNPYAMIPELIDDSDYIDDLVDNIILCGKCGLEYIRNGNQSIDDFISENYWSAQIEDLDDSKTDFSNFNSPEYSPEINERRIDHILKFIKPIQKSFIFCYSLESKVPMRVKEFERISERIFPKSKKPNRFAEWILKMNFSKNPFPLKNVPELIDFKKKFIEGLL